MKALPENGRDIRETLGHDRKPSKRKVAVWVVAGLIIASLIAGGLLLHKSNNNPSLHYRTEEVQNGTLTVTVTATGELQPLNQVDVGTEVSGTIETVVVDYNDRVKAGQVLAKLDIAKFEAEVLASQAALESAQAKLLEAQANIFEARSELNRLEHVLKLSGGKVPAQHDLDVARAACKRAEAEEAIARAQIAEAEAKLNFDKTNYEKAIIRSPIDGIVLERQIEPGQTVAASLQTPVLFTLAEDLTQMELLVDVDEADVGQVLEGQNATFTVDAYPDQSFPAKINQIRYAAKTVDGVVTYETVLIVDNSALLLRPGMTATADIIVKKLENVLLIPNTALRFTPPLDKKPSSRGGLMGKLLPHPPRGKKRNRKDLGGSVKQQRVWTLNKRKLVPVFITIGSTDGIMTEVVGGGLTPEMHLVVDTVSLQ
jgi:HlyD family secretion protein